MLFYQFLQADGFEYRFEWEVINYVSFAKNFHLLSSAFGGSPLPPPLRRRRLWMAPKGFDVFRHLFSQFFHEGTVFRKDYHCFLRNAQ